MYTLWRSTNVQRERSSYVNRPVTLAMLFKFFAATWLLVSLGIGIAVQTRFNDLAHIEKRLERIDQLLVEHVLNNK